MNDRIRLATYRTDNGTFDKWVQRTDYITSSAAEQAEIDKQLSRLNGNSSRPYDNGYRGIDPSPLRK